MFRFSSTKKKPNNRSSSRVVDPNLADATSNDNATNSSHNRTDSSQNSNVNNGNNNSKFKSAVGSDIGKFDHITLDEVGLSLKDVSPADQPKLFLRHLKICQETFSFNDVSMNNCHDMNLMDAEYRRQKERTNRKRDLLLGLVEYFNNPRTNIHESEFQDILNMISANLFRALPPKIDLLLDADEDDPVLESSWPHLQMVYEVLLRFIVCTDVEPKTARKYISHSFILKLLGLFDSEDPRERDYLKTILHRIYGKFMALRAFIRKSMLYVFLSSTYLDDYNNGIAELLEILGSIINGFALPLKPEHRRFLSKGLIPLHKMKSIGAFHTQLEYCITQYVEKDNEMAEPVILGLLKFWPDINSTKQVLYLHELENVLELTRAPEFREIIQPLFKRLALCIDSQHFQVAERTLTLWQNEYIFTLITQNRSDILPIVFNVLHKNSESHWNSNVQNLSQNVLKSFQELDSALYYEVSELEKIESKKKVQIIKQNICKWDILLEKSKQHDLINVGLPDAKTPPQ